MTYDEGRLRCLSINARQMSRAGVNMADYHPAYSLIDIFNNHMFIPQFSGVSDSLLSNGHFL